MRILTQRKTRGKKNVTRHERNADLKKSRVTIEGINIVKKHRRARKADEQSGIIEMPAPVAVSNVMLLDPKTGKPTRVRARIDIDPKTKDRTKERVSAKSGEPISFNR
jgi:large subunit ribosomal protein L24